MVETKITVADYIANFLVEKGVEHVFGYQGGAVTKIIDSMVATGKIEYVQNYHEQASALAADGYARVNHKLGVAIATSGPGATNLITGIANAQLDSIPTLYITGQDYKINSTRNNGARLNGFQDLDIVSVVKPITKYAVMLLDAEDIRYELEKCHYLATNGRPGAVLIDIPIDIQFAVIEPAALKGFVPEENTAEYEFDKIESLIGLIQEAKRPVILAGGGIQISSSVDVIEELRRITGIPVVSTLNGLDAVQGGHSFAGLHGNVFANIIIKNADLIIALGTRLGQRQVGKKPREYTSAKVAHIDIDKVEFERAIDESLSIYAPLKQCVERLNSELQKRNIPDFSEWSATADMWEKKYADTAELNTKKIRPVLFSKKIISALPQDTIICSDVGQNQMWVAQAFTKRGNMRLLNSSGLGTMGYSLPASIGARYANPDACIVSCTGDGGLLMNLQELLLIGQKQLDIKIIVYNNNTLGMMREVQGRYYNSNYHGANEREFACIDLEKAANTFGLTYVKIANEHDFPAILPFIASNKPCIIELEIDMDSKLSNRYDEGPIIQENMLNA